MIIVLMNKFFMNQPVFTIHVDVIFFFVIRYVILASQSIPQQIFYILLNWNNYIK